MSFAFSPQGGQLVVNSSPPYTSETVNSTTERNSNPLMPSLLSVIAASDCNAYKGGIAGGIIGACLLGLFLGVLFAERFRRRRHPVTAKAQSVELGAPFEVHENLNNQREPALSGK